MGGREQDLANPRADLGPAGLPREDDVLSDPPQAVGDQGGVRRLPGEIESLKDDQLSLEVDGRLPPKNA